MLRPGDEVLIFSSDPSDTAIHGKVVSAERDSITVLLSRADDTRVYRHVVGDTYIGNDNFSVTIRKVRHDG